MATFSDDFNRSNEDLFTSSDWTEEGDTDANFDIVSNQLEADGDVPSLSTDSTAVVQTTFDANHEAEADCVSDAGNGHIGVGVRYDTVGNYYKGYYRGNSDNWRIGRLSGGSFTSLAQSNAPSSLSNVNFRVVANGDDLEFFIDDSSELTATDTTHPDHTQVCLSIFNRGTSTWDNFAARDLAANLTGQVEAAAEVAATLSVVATGELAAAVEAAVEASGSVSQVHRLAGAVEATAEVEGALSVVIEEVTELSGAVENGAEAAATLSQSHELVGQLESATETEGTSTQTHNLSGAVENGSETQGSLVVNIVVAGAVTAAAEIAGRLSQTHVLGGNIESGTETEGSFAQTQRLVAAVQVAAEIVGLLASVVQVQKGFNDVAHVAVDTSDIDHTKVGDSTVGLAGVGSMDVKHAKVGDSTVGLAGVGSMDVKHG